MGTAIEVINDYDDDDDDAAAADDDDDDADVDDNALYSDAHSAPPRTL